MRILNECSFLKPEGIKVIEEKYKAKYVFESCLRQANDKGWHNWPVAVFYTEEAHPQGSNYFALYRDLEGQFMITNGISATADHDALLVGEDIVYSRYRHDYRTHKGAMVDGGRDYFKRSSDKGTPVKLHVVGDHLEVVE